ncbi:MAG TPA: FAD-dependent oxidoreductase [Chthonomonadales bacterium]|nr:FAD-dependent oxidoreductase [Chthonomonadales bacterium]
MSRSRPALQALMPCILLAAGIHAAAASIPPPASFEAIAASPDEIDLYWLPAAGAQGYTLYRDGTQLASVGADLNRYCDKGLAPDSTHRYSIEAQQGAAHSSRREYVERTLPPFPSLSGGKGLPVAKFDVVIAQASSSGVAAAVEAAQRGLRVALIEPTTRPGGMPVNGLSATDLRRPQHACGFFVRFRNEVKKLYAAEGIKSSGLEYEPRIALQAMKSLIYRFSNITLFERARLQSVQSHRVKGELPGVRHIDSVIVAELDKSGRATGRCARFVAPFFVDATDCGDLAAWAGARFKLGREKRSVAEPQAGVIYYDRAHDLLLPGSTGKGDRRIQAYTYLLTVKDYGKAADRTIAAPPGYRMEDYIHTPAWKQSWAVTSGRMPGGKYELNQHPEGGDLQEVNYPYPTAGYAVRARIEELYRNRALGYLYYIQTHLGQKQLGLPDDEYRDTGGFPPLLYVREGRRIVGEQTPREADVRTSDRFSRPESVGIGDYPMDSHAVRPKRDWSRPDLGEGEWWLYRITPVHQLPLGVIIPRDVDNLFVTTAVSSTHVSFGTYRLEPVRMAFGQAAGAAVELCITYRLTGQQLPARELQLALLPHSWNQVSRDEAVLSYFTDLAPDDPHYSQLQYFACRGFFQAETAIKPGADATQADLTRWLSLLAARAAPPAQRERTAFGWRIKGGYYPNMGRPYDSQTLSSLQQFANSTRAITRAQAVRWIYRVFPPTSMDRWPITRTYGDVADKETRRDADALFSQGFDARLWDGEAASAPNGSLRLRPNAPIKRTDLLATLYLVQLGLGPLFMDNPADGATGYNVPQAVMNSTYVGSD